MINVNIEILETRKHKRISPSPLKRAVETNITTYKIEDKHIPSVNRTIDISDKDSGEVIITKVVETLNDMKKEIDEYERLFQFSMVKNEGISLNK